MKAISRILAAFALCAACAFVLHAASPPSDGIKRTDLQRHDLSVAGREVIQVRVDIAPGVTFPDHSHPGEEIVYVIEGVLEYRIDGGSAVRLGPGEVLFIPAGAIHSAKNPSNSNAAELATYVVEKNKSLVVLAR